jgi:hypothetical protein
MAGSFESRRAAFGWHGRSRRRGPQGQYLLLPIIVHFCIIFTDKMLIQNRDRPLVLVSHCFGSVILKQAFFFLAWILSLLRQKTPALAVASQQYERYIGILNMISRVEFLRSRHSGSDSEALAEKLLKLYTNELSKQTVTRLEKESSLIKNAALRFEDVFLRVDIASICGIGEAKIREGSNVRSKTVKS